MTFMDDFYDRGNKRLKTVMHCSNTCLEHFTGKQIQLGISILERLSCIPARMGRGYHFVKHAIKRILLYGLGNTS